MERGGRVFNLHFGPYRARLHARLWRPFALLTYGRVGSNVRALTIGAY